MSLSSKSRPGARRRRIAIGEDAHGDGQSLVPVVETHISKGGDEPLQSPAQIVDPILEVVDDVGFVRSMSMLMSIHQPFDLSFACTGLPAPGGRYRSIERRSGIVDSMAPG